MSGAEKTNTSQHVQLRTMLLSSLMTPPYVGTTGSGDSRNVAIIGQVGQSGGMGDTVQAPFAIARTLGITTGMVNPGHHCCRAARTTQIKYFMLV